MIRLLLNAAALIVTACAFTHANAQTEYPVKPIRMVIPYAPGGTNDVVGRLVAAKTGELLGQQIVIENRGGAGGAIGVELAARAAPDGYTLLFGNIGVLAINPSLYRKLSYDPLKDLQTISLVAKVPNILVVHPSLPARSVKQLITLAKAKPGELTFGSGGAGSGSHLTAEYMKLLAKIDIVHVPYKGVGPALVDLLAGQTQMVFAGAPGVTAYVRAGRLRALAVSGARRIAALPELPTLAEATGLADFEATLWYGVLGPAGLSNAVVGKLNGTLVRALQQADLRERLAADGTEPVSSSPADFSAFIKAEITRWAPVIRASGAKPD